MSFRGLLRLVAAAVMASGAAACSASTTGASVNLTGDYGLVSVAFGEAAALTPPTETGTLSLSATAYSLTLAGSVSETDNGTYSIGNGAAWTQDSATQGVQSTGTYSWTGTTLTVTTVQHGVTVAAVWQRLS